MPQPLVDQLARGGRMFIPVGPSGHQEIIVVDKDPEGDVKQKCLMSVSYVPLTHAKAQWSPSDADGGSEL